MVLVTDVLFVGQGRLSVLALSSRFDGRGRPEELPTRAVTFSTRSVESF